MISRVNLLSLSPSCVISKENPIAAVLHGGLSFSSRMTVQLHHKTVCQKALTAGGILPGQPDGCRVYAYDL